MKLKFALLVFALFVIGLSWTTSMAQEVKNPAPSVTAKASLRGETYSYKLFDQDFAGTPSWKVEMNEEPPLSVQKALIVARQSLPRFVQSVELWKAKRISLNSIGDDKWYYAIYFNCFGAQCRNLPERSFMSVVKMDGTIVEPKRLVEQ